MCIRVRSASSIDAPYDHVRKLIIIPAGLSAERIEIAVRAVLAKLGVEQPPRGAICWCGERVLVEGAVIAPVEEVINIGA